MTSHSGAIKAESILNRLAILTANRDTEMLEQSLLKALSDMLHLRDVMLFKVNSLREPYHIVHHHRRMALPEREGQLMYGASADDVPKHLLDAACSAKYDGTPYVHKNSNGYSVMYAITGREEVIGYVVLFVKSELTHAQMQIVRGLLAIVNNFYALLIESQQDKLTGLLNRKTFDDSIGKICSSIALGDKPGVEPERRKPPAIEHRTNWLAILDIDFFKQVNDKYGHLYGDEVLLLLSQIMKRCFREEDLLFRYGGEEFLVVAGFESQEVARAVLDRFRQEVGLFRFPQVGTITVSIGAVQVKNQVAAAEIVGQADQALYYAKAHGRNCLYFYDDLLKEGIIASPSEVGAIDYF